MELSVKETLTVLKSRGADVSNISRALTTEAAAAAKGKTSARAHSTLVAAVKDANHEVAFLATRALFEHNLAAIRRM